MRTKKAKPPPNVEFRTIWNGERRTFDVYRNGVKTGMFSQAFNTSIGLARAEAIREIGIDRRLGAIITSVKEGKVIKEMRLP